MPFPNHVAVKVAFAVSLAFGTAGCADSQADFFPQDNRFQDVGCRAIANDRATDAGIIDDDVEMQRQVFSLTYASCMDWRRTH